jgi:hypothetical protein
MKLDQLRKVIREEVRSAIKEELQEVLTEAVKVASTPTKQTFYTSNTASAIPTKVAKPSKMNPVAGKRQGTLEEMLNQTRSEMTNEDYKTVISGTSDMVSKPNFASSMANQMGMSGPQPGLDLSSLDFIKKAKQIFDKAESKGKNKL